VYAWVNHLLNGKTMPAVHSFLVDIRRADVFGKRGFHLLLFAEHLASLRDAWRLLRLVSGGGVASLLTTG
jgi:hypothetical protein